MVQSWHPKQQPVRVRNGWAARDLTARALSRQKMVNFVLKTRNCVFKTRNFAFKMLSFAAETCLRARCGGEYYMRETIELTWPDWVYFTEELETHMETHSRCVVTPPVMSSSGTTVQSPIINGQLPSN